jgi:hypothetical protein
MNDSSDGNTAEPAASALPAEVLPMVPVATPRASAAWKWALAVAVVLGGTALMAARLHDVQRELQKVQQRADELAAQRQQDAVHLHEFEDRIEATARRTEQLDQKRTVFAGRGP